MADTPPALSSKNLQLSYGSHKALDGLNLAIPKNGITALLGSNGAGKTTFIKCALGLLKANAGELKVLGKKSGSKGLKRDMGVMMQDADLPDLLSAREHLTLVCSYYPNALPVADLIQQCGLSSFADKRYKNLSGGQKRRVQFAFAIAGQPKLVFLDEPTTGLDLEARRTLWNTIRNLSNNGTTVLLTTHYLEEADALADHTIVISRGKAIAQGTANDIRNLVSGAVIRCQTSIKAEQIQNIGSVNTVRTSGRFIEILSNEPTATARELLAQDASLSDLTVNTPSLEEAFEQLLQTHRATTLEKEHNNERI